jgi:hypothetical protein
MTSRSRGSYRGVEPRRSNVDEKRNEKDPQTGEGEVTEEVVHGGEDDPLGGGVSELEEDDGATEGEPKQT